MSNFKAFKNAVASQFSRMQGYPLFRAAVEKDQLWATYIASFPAGSNPIYRQRSEYDCGCCRNFVRSVGDVVAVIDGKIVSLWDIAIADEPAYRQVADALSALVHSVGIKDHFFHYERTAGTDKNFEQLAGEVKTWDHFFVNLPAAVVKKKTDIPTVLAELREPKNVLLRSLAEISAEAIDTVLELIAQDSLYRGQEHRFAVQSFQEMKRKFNVLTTDGERDIFAWTNSTGAAGSVAKIRNTVIGTLLVDLSSGVEMEQAVKAFEVKVAPTNYKRPTALVTKAMVDNAKQAVEDLGLTSALKRRYATVHDITVNNILFANRDAKRSIDGDVFAEIATTPAKAKNLDRVEEVSIDKFLSDVLPRVESLEIMVENRHASNFVSLIAPDDPTAGELFKWPNRFSWSYNGEMADAIKERVKAAGGSVTGDLCCRLAWDYTDDLDFHMKEPGGSRIYYANKRHGSPNGGILDLDANGGDGIRADPAENIYYSDRRRMREGDYDLSVNNFCRRSSGVGFVVQIELDGQLFEIAYDKALRANETVRVATIRYQSGAFEIIESLPSSQTSRQVWGLNTQTFHPINVLMLSPNHWDGRDVGNKHYFFMIDGCRNDGSARGFFNEFLKADLDRHRKVLEMVGSKVKVDSSDQQLSGLGFSSTIRNSIVCRVKGSFTRMLKITF